MNCPRCGTEFVRVKRDKMPKPRQQYYFLEWDKCPECHFVQQYNEFRRAVKDIDNEPLAKNFAPAYQPRIVVSKEEKLRKAAEDGIMFLCAYYALKEMGEFSEVKGMPNHDEITAVVAKKSGLSSLTPIEYMLEQLDIHWSRGLIDFYRKNRKKKKIKTPKQPKQKKAKQPKPSKLETARKVVRPKVKYIPSEEFFSSREWRELRYKALEINGGACQCCGRSRKAHGVILHVDHIKPRSKYPELQLDLTNLQVLCEDCNMGKSNKFCTDWR